MVRCRCCGLRRFLLQVQKLFLRVRKRLLRVQRQLRKYLLRIRKECASTLLTQRVSFVTCSATRRHVRSALVMPKCSKRRTHVFSKQVLRISSRILSQWEQHLNAPRECGLATSKAKLLSGKREVAYRQQLCAICSIRLRNNMVLLLSNSQRRMRSKMCAFF